MKKKNKEKPIIGFSIGDINGIGPEILIKSLSNDAILNQFTPVIFCNPEIINYYCKILNKEINYILVNSISKIILNKINLINPKVVKSPKLKLIFQKSIKLNFQLSPVDVT